MQIKHEIILSIVTPTRGNFSEYWLSQLLKVQGDVEFILVYPPDALSPQIDDSRIKILISPYKGEVIQRFIGLFNARGKYVLALDDDDFVHPMILNLVNNYFEHFPTSLVLRLMVKPINYENQELIKQDWADLPNVKQMVTGKRRDKEQEKTMLQEVPIAPLQNKFDARHLFLPYRERRDMHGAHIENFNNKVWKNELVRQALVDLAQTMKFMGAITWIPQWSLDRLLGLFIQAKFFKQDVFIGHWMPLPEQARYIKMPRAEKNEFIRLILPADALLVKKFPQYGYFWNLLFEQFWVAVRTIGHKILKN